MNDTDTNYHDPGKTGTSRVGSANPMWGRSHTQSTKDLMSRKAKERYQKWKHPEEHLTMDEFLSNNPMTEQYLKKIIQEEISRLL